MVYILSMLYRDDHKDVTNRKGRTWTPKPRSDLGHWNGMTVYETGKPPQVTSEIRQFNHHVLGVSESRWTGSGKITVIAGKNCPLLWEGWLSTPWRSSHHTQKSNRMVSAKLKGKHINITLIQCYAPKDDGSDEDKDKSYSQLQAELEKTLWRDLVVIMGELNAQVGRDNTDNERVMEKHGVGNRNLTIMVRDWWSSVVRDWWRSVQWIT